MSNPPENTNQTAELRECLERARQKFITTQTLLSQPIDASSALPALYQGWVYLKLAQEEWRTYSAKHGVRDGEFENLKRAYESFPTPGHSLSGKQMRQYTKDLGRSLDQLENSLPHEKRLWLKTRNWRIAPRALPWLVFSFLWISAVCTVVVLERPDANNGLRGSYFKDTQFAKLHCNRDDRLVDFNWQNKAPFSGMKPDRFSVRWDGYVLIKEGEAKRFILGADDGAILYIDDEVLIDNSGSHRYVEKRAEKLVGPGRHRIVVAFVDEVGHARISLKWNSETGYKEIVPRNRLYLE